MNRKYVLLPCLLTVVLSSGGCPSDPGQEKAPPAGKGESTVTVPAVQPPVTGLTATPASEGTSKNEEGQAAAVAREEAATGWDPARAWADGGERGPGDARSPVESKKPAAPAAPARGPEPDKASKARDGEEAESFDAPGHALGASGMGMGGGGRHAGGVKAMARARTVPRGGYALEPIAPGRPVRPVATGQAMAVALTSDRIVRAMPPRPSSWPRNARYSSNYLPGRGYLDGLAASLSRQGSEYGVQDVGLLAPARKSPRLPAPTGRSLDLAVDQLYPRVPPEGIQTTLRVRLRAADGVPRTRQPLRLHLVLDGSGSMKGESWKQVCAAVRDVAARLGPEDLMSVVIFDETARCLSPPVPGGEAAAVASKVCAVRPGRETNIYAGLVEGYAQARAVYSPRAINRVLVLSDGMPTRGPTDPYTLTTGTTDALGSGITTSTVGIGSGFDALIMGRVASEGAGNFHFVRDRSGVPAVFTDELRVLAEEAAEVVEVRVRLDRRVRLLEVVGSTPLGVAESLRVRGVEVATDQRLASEQGIAADRIQDLDAGVRFLIPSFRMGDEHAFVLNLHVPGNMPPPGRIARVELRYKDMAAGRNVYVHAESMVWPARDRTAAEAAANNDVTVAEARARASDALRRASEYMDVINVARIRDELYTAAQALSVAAGRAGDVLAQADADRVRRMADRAGLVSGQQAWGQLASLYHYGWRTCGLTYWR